MLICNMLRQIKASMFKFLNTCANYISFGDNAEGVMEVKIEGNTLKNELTYNPETWEEWAKSAGVVGDSTGLEITADGINYKTAKINTNLKSSTKYGVLINVISDNYTSSRKIRFDGSGVLNTGVYFDSVGVGNKKTIITTKDSITNNNLLLVAGDSIETSGNKRKLKDIRVYELPTDSQIETDFNTLTADELAVKYPFHSGIWSVGEDETGGNNHKIEVLSCGKNKFDKSKTSDGYRIKNTDGSSSTNALMCITDFISIKPSTNYNFSGFNLIDGQQHGAFYDSNKNFISGFYSATNSGITPANAKYLRYSIPISYKDTFQIEEGTVATAYEPYKVDKIDISMIAPLRGIPNGARDIHSSDGIRTNKVGKVVLNGSENWSLQANLTNDTFVTLYTLIKMNNSIVICDKFPYNENTTQQTCNSEGVKGSKEFNVVYIRILKSKLSTQDVAGFKAWLATNNVTVYYELATPTTENSEQLLLRSYPKGTLQINTLIPPNVNIKYPY